jgi:hypothetical protein
LDHVLIDWVDEVENFISSLLKGLHEWGSSNLSSALTSDVVDIFLSFLHSSDVVLVGNLFLTRFGGVESEEIGDLLSVGSVLVDTEFQVLGELFIELFVVLLVFSDLSEHFKALLDDVLLDDLQDSVLLESFSGNVKWEIVGIDNTLNE